MLMTEQSREEVKPPQSEEDRGTKRTSEDEVVGQAKKSRVEEDDDNNPETGMECEEQETNGSDSALLNQERNTDEEYDKYIQDKKWEREYNKRMRKEL